MGQMEDMRIAVSANLPGATSDMRQKTLQDFSSNKTQFLITHSEPAVCQVMLPKVSCVFHFGIVTDMPSIYGIRLLPLDEKLTKESASIFVADRGNSETKSRSRFGSEQTPVAKLEKLFGISFMDLPWEFMPSAPSM